MKKFFTTVILAAITATSFAANPPKDGPVILIITVQVKDFKAWKTGFDKNEAVRQQAGIKVLTIASEENETKAVVVEQAESRKSAEEFLGKLKAKMQETGASPVEVRILDKE